MQRSLWFIAIVAMFLYLGSNFDHFWYKYASLDNFVHISKVTAIQTEKEIVLHTLYREVKTEMRGYVTRYATCLEDNTGVNQSILISNTSFIFDKNPQDKAELPIPVNKFDTRCHTWDIKNQYVFIMPDGSERVHPMLTTDPFRVVFPGEEEEPKEQVGVTPSVNAPVVNKPDTERTEAKRAEVEKPSQTIVTVEQKNETKEETKEEPKKQGLINDEVPVLGRL